MFSIKEILTFAYESEYDSAYDLLEKRLFSKPKIYTANGDLNRRWYIYFSFRHPKTGKLKRLTPFYGNANKYKSKEERLEVLATYRKVLLKLLNSGYNPFEDNSLLFERLNRKIIKIEEQEHEKLKFRKELSSRENDTTTEIKLSVSEAFEFGLKLKERVVSERTLKDYKNKADSFLKWLNTHYPDITTVDKLNKNLFQGFLNDILGQSSPRNRNNYRSDLSSLLQVLIDNDVMNQNYLKGIKKLTAKPERHKTYTTEIENNIFKYLKERDPILLMFIKFYSYTFMRPIEVCRIKVKDLNIKDKTVQFKAKNSKLKTKILPQILLNELPDISKLEPNMLLFTMDRIGGIWDANENSRRNHFSKRFKKVIKDHFKLGTDYGLYSFRHTFVTKLYKEIAKESSPNEAKSRLMQITGHSTMTALEKYLRDIDAELPPDFSNMLK